MKRRLMKMRVSAQYRIHQLTCNDCSPLGNSRVYVYSYLVILGTMVLLGRSTS